jgi:hypothetical protein
MAETNREAEFIGKYQEAEKIWSGPSFMQYHDFKLRLAELPVSAVAVANQTYSRKFLGNLEYVYGEMLYSLAGFEGYLRDKGFKVEECYVQPRIGRSTYVLEFAIRYRIATGEEVTRRSEVLRLGETKFIFYTDYYRPL